jgi:cytochrome c oxidase assembly factor CtaG
MAAFADAGDVLPPFGWSSVLARWQFAPLVTSLVAVAAVAYLWGVWRVGRRHPARPWPRWRTGLFLGGLAAVVIATQSGVGAYDDVLFWDHMIQHLLLIMVAPPLLVAGQPVTLLLHASRNPLHTWAKRAVRSRLAAALTWPPFTIAAYAATIAVTHLTGLMNLVLTNAHVHDLEHVLYVVVGYLFFLPLVGNEPVRWRLSYPLRMLVLAITMPVDTFTGVVLGSAGSEMFPAYAAVHRTWGPSLTSDLHLGGATMWIGGDAIMFAVIMTVFAAWSRDPRAATGRGWLESARRANLERLTGTTTAPGPDTASAAAPPGGGGSPDDDDHLAAYNAYLARLNKTGDGGCPGQAFAAECDHPAVEDCGQD